MIIPFVGETYESQSPTQNNQLTINWFIEEDTHGGLTNKVLLPTPGTSIWVDIGGSVVRSLFVHKAYLYAVVDGNLLKIDSSKNITTIHALDTTTGSISVAAINNQIVWVDGTSGYHYNTDTTTYTKITDVDFPTGCTQIAALDGYFIAVKPSSDTFYVSALNDGLTGWTATDFATAEGDSDNISAVVVWNKIVYFLGELTIELWYDSGTGVPPFQPQQGAFYQYGLAAPKSVATGDQSLFFLAQDRNGNSQVIRTYQGWQVKAIASRAISYQISQMTTISDAIGYIYQRNSHEFYVLTFPTENRTFVYDLSTDSWHERQSYNGIDYGRHVGNCHANFAGQNLIGDFSSGKILYYDETNKYDVNQPIKRVRRSSPIFFENKKLTFWDLELWFEAGIGNVNDPGLDPQVILRISRDGGHKWGAPIYKSVGKLGEYTKRVLFTRLGTGRKWVFEVSVTDPNNWIFIGGAGSVSPELPLQKGNQ